MSRYAITLVAAALGAALCCTSCRRQADDGADPKVTALGSAEVTAQLVEIRDTFPPNNLYDYVYILKYAVLEVHRGRIDGKTILVGQYNPLKPRAQLLVELRRPGLAPQHPQRQAKIQAGAHQE